MIKVLPLIRIFTDSKKSIDKINSLFSSIPQKKFDYEVCLNGQLSGNYERIHDIEVIYAYPDLKFAEKKIDHIVDQSDTIFCPVLFLCNGYPENILRLAHQDNLIYDFLLMPASIELIQNKIDHLIFLSQRSVEKKCLSNDGTSLSHANKISIERKQKAVDLEDTKSLLSIQHKIEYYSWFQHDLETSLKFLLNTLLDLEWMDGGGVYLFDSDTDDLVLISHLGLSDEFIKENFRFNRESTPFSLLNQKKFFFSNFRSLSKKIKKTSNTEQILAIAILPLIHRGDLIGAINLASKSKEVIPHNDRIALESIASKISTNISYLKALDELEKSKLKLESEVKKRTYELEKTNQRLQQEITFHKETKEEYGELQSNIPIGIFMTNLKGEILHANKALASMLGYDSEAKLLKILITKFYHNKDRIKEITKTLKEEGTVNMIELLIDRKDKTTFWGSLSINSVIDKNSNSGRLSGIIEDISEKKNAQVNLEKAHEEILRTNQNLEKKIKDALKEQEQQHQYIIQKSKLESLGELAAGIAHEINQPLGIMSLAFENLQVRFNDNSITKEYLGKKTNSIIKNIERIRDIIDHIRIFSREQDSFVMQKVDVNIIILNVHKLIKTQYQNHNIIIVHELSENLGFTVGSRLKLEQVLLNLLSNAKYALDENEVNQDSNEYSKTIEIKTFFKNNRINLTVQDNGIGIEPENINKIFDPFYTTKPEWVGTGLGLSIIYGIINEMHGGIKVYSKVNEYTRFEIYLPRFPEKD